MPKESIYFEVVALCFTVAPGLNKYQGTEKLTISKGGAADAGFVTGLQCSVCTVPKVR